MGCGCECEVPLPVPAQTAHLLTQISDDMLAESPAHERCTCSASPAAATPLTRRTSSDGGCRFAEEALDGLNSMSWQRIPATASLVALNMHVFLIGKRSQQREVEYQLSTECIKCLVEVLAD